MEKGNVHPTNVPGECTWGFIVRMYIECTFQFIEALKWGLREQRPYWWEKSCLIYQLFLNVLQVVSSDTGLLLF